MSEFEAAPTRPGTRARLSGARVLIAHPSAELYGADRQVVQTAREFVTLGWRVSVVLAEGGPNSLLGQALTAVGAEVLQLRTPVLRRSLLRPLGLLRLLAATPRTLSRQVRLIRRLAPDAVIANTVTLPHWVLAARLVRCPVVVHVHEAEEMGPLWARRLLYQPLRAAHRVIANSAATRRVITSAAPSLSARTVTVPNGVPDPGPQHHDAVVPGRLVVVSRLSPRKGITEAVDAVRLLIERGRDVTLELCGSVFAGYEWFEDELRRAVGNDARLRDRVIFAGFVDPVTSAFARAQIVLAPSYGESFGNSVVEAMLTERPVVATNVQGLAEVVDHGRTGLLVPVGDAAALAGTVAELLDDPAETWRMAAAGRSEALRRFSPAQYGHALAAVLTDLIGGGAGKAEGHIKTADFVSLDTISDEKSASVATYCRCSARPERSGCTQ